MPQTMPRGIKAMIDEVQMRRDRVPGHRGDAIAQLP